MSCEQINKRESHCCATCMNVRCESDGFVWCKFDEDSETNLIDVCDSYEAHK